MTDEEPVWREDIEGKTIYIVAGRYQKAMENLFWANVGFLVVNVGWLFVTLYIIYRLDQLNAIGKLIGVW